MTLPWAVWDCYLCGVHARNWACNKCVCMWLGYIYSGLSSSFSSFSSLTLVCDRSLYPFVCAPPSAYVSTIIVGSPPLSCHCLFSSSRSSSARHRRLFRPPPSPSPSFRSSCRVIVAPFGLRVLLGCHLAPWSCSHLRGMLSSASSLPASSVSV